MPTTYQTDEDATDLAYNVMKLYHPDLAKVEMTLTVLMALAEKDEHGEPLAPALKHHGWPAIAIVKINSLQDRVEGKSDVTIRIDEDWWKDHDDRERRAVLDHELEHVKVKMKDDMPQSDDVGRPKLKIKPHDYELAGFHAVAHRHGERSAEVQQATIFAKTPTGQLLMWG